MEESLKGKGSLVFSNFSLTERATFLDYIMGGCEIGVHVAIDFTLSNGKPSNVSSLHNIKNGTN
jgi:hypothetical protein